VNRPDPLSAAPSGQIADVARKLAAVGGGDLSLDLALDLVLHETVKQARTATGATGAAIALRRDGEMVCRATTGANAPDLGVRVETDSGLLGACLASGEVQQCADTQADPRVNAEACLALGIRSTLLVPLKEKGRTVGVLQAFSTEPKAFHGSDVEVLQRLAKKLSEDRNGSSFATATSAMSPVPPSTGSDRLAEKLKSLELLEVKSEPLVSNHPGSEEPEVRKTDLWASVLVVLVIVTAIALGIVIGWRGGTKVGGTNQTKIIPTSKIPAHTSSRSTSSTTASGAPNSAEPAAGGLTVTENGKVIYRISPSQSGASTSSESDAASNRLIHKVEPQYPELARQRKIQGPVVLDVQVLGDGSVGNVQIVSGDPLLADSAIRAVKQWRYEPYSVNGQPVATLTRVTIKFTLSAS
jgi:TonB family protein